MEQAQWFPLYIYIYITVLGLGARSYQEELSAGYGLLRILEDDANNISHSTKSGCSLDQETVIDEIKDLRRQPEAFAQSVVQREFFSRC